MLQIYYINHDNLTSGANFSYDVDAGDIAVDDGSVEGYGECKTHEGEYIGVTYDAGKAVVTWSGGENKCGE